MPKTRTSSSLLLSTHVFLCLPNLVIPRVCHNTVLRERWRPLCRSGIRLAFLGGPPFLFDVSPFSVLPLSPQWSLFPIFPPPFRLLCRQTFLFSFTFIFYLLLGSLVVCAKECVFLALVVCRERGVEGGKWKPFLWRFLVPSLSFAEGEKKEGNHAEGPGD